MQTKNRNLMGLISEGLQWRSLTLRRIARSELAEKQLGLGSAAVSAARFTGLLLSWTGTFQWGRNSGSSPRPLAKTICGEEISEKKKEKKKDGRLGAPGNSSKTSRDVERKRFYQNVTISQGEGGFEINLDHGKLKTPQAKLFTVPSETLALAVATEWDSQKDTIKSYTMHLTTLCNTALDNPSHRSKDQLIRAAVKFLETDTICYRVEEPPALVELQRNEWDPVIEWAEERYEVVIGSSTSIMGPNIPQHTRDVFISHLASYNIWALHGIEYMVAQLKSLILSMALLDKHLTVEQAVLLSRLEEEYQIQRWGHVEWAHDYDMYDLRARTAAATLFIHLCSESATVKHKLLQD